MALLIRVICSNEPKFMRNTCGGRFDIFQTGDFSGRELREMFIIIHGKNHVELLEDEHNFELFAGGNLFGTKWKYK